jgi:hypothetical protein
MAEPQDTKIVGCIFDPHGKPQEEVVDEIMAWVEVMKLDYEKRKAAAIAAKKAREAKSDG